MLRAARLADAWLLNPHTKLDELERQLGLYHAERERRGLAPAVEIPIVKELHVGDDDASAMRAAQPFLEDKYRAYVQWGQSEVLPEGDTLRQAFDRLAEGGRFIVGGPETCARQIREHVERLGATTFLFRFQWPGMPQELVLSSMRRAAESVFPLLRSGARRRPWRRCPPRRGVHSTPRPRRRAAGSRSATARCAASGAAPGSPPRRRS